ncbi:UNVERIFIED_CONTAM: hypothetical protein Sradi_6165500 [Sesamum radiatum]|uniref:CCHC-type domain-containing protein n=1 Tax=Sesamum radiatum TaxID=300843 RepID=A0AAW2K8K3_SESRA
MPAGIWHSDPDNGGFHVVGCVYSHKSYHVEAIKTVLQSSLNPAKGMTISFIENGHFLLKFFRAIDRDRILESGPWAFEKNLIVLAKVAENENPTEVKGPELWGSFMHLRIAIDVMKPLPRVLKIRTVLGDEQIINFTYERLPNYCYLCGKIGYISKWCESCFRPDFVDPGDNSPYGSWLCALTRADSKTRFPQSSSFHAQTQFVRPRFSSKYGSRATPSIVNIRGSAIFGVFPKSAAYPDSFDSIPSVTPTPVPTKPSGESTTIPTLSPTSVVHS